MVIVLKPMSGIVKEGFAGAFSAVLTTAIVSLGTFVVTSVGSFLFDDFTIASLIFPDGLFTPRHFYGLPLFALAWVTVLLFQKLRSIVRGLYGFEDEYGGAIFVSPDRSVQLTYSGVRYEVSCAGQFAQSTTALCLSCNCQLIITDRWILPGVKYACPACGESNRTLEPHSNSSKKVKLLAEHILRKQRSQ